MLQLQLSSTAEAVNLVPVTISQSNSELEVPISSSSMAPYGNTQLKIIVSHPLGQRNPVIPASVDGQSKTNMVLLSPENQDMVVNSMIQQVNLLAPVQPLGSSDTAGTTIEPHTVLLTQLSSEDNGNPLHQALLQTAISTENPNSAQTFITTCSELEGISTLIQGAGTEVTVVTGGDPALVTAAPPPSMDLTKPTDRMKVEESALQCQGSALLVPNINLGSQNVVIHGVPLIVSTQPQQSVVEHLTPHTLYTDSNTLEGLPQ